MSVKLIAVGNVLMGDDGAAVWIAGMLAEELSSLGIELIYGETDIGYCLLKISEEDYLILLDCAYRSREPGKITVTPLESYRKKAGCLAQHDICLPEFLKLYKRYPKGVILTIEAAKIDFEYGMSPQLRAKAADISIEILNLIKKLIEKETPVLQDKEGAV